MHDQAEDRCHRIGQRDAVTAWYLLAAETIDETMAEVLARKRGIIGAVTDGRSDESEAVLQSVVQRAARQAAAPPARRGLATSRRTSSARAARRNAALNAISHRDRLTAGHARARPARGDVVARGAKGPRPDRDARAGGAAGRHNQTGGPAAEAA